MTRIATTQHNTVMFGREELSTEQALVVSACAARLSKALGNNERLMRVSNQLEAAAKRARTRRLLAHAGELLAHDHGRYQREMEN